MTKQEFAIKLLFWFMPYPMSRALPKILLRLLRGPSAETPGLWVQAAFSALSQLFDDVVSYAESLLLTVADIPSTEQLAALSAALRAAIEKAKLLLSTLADIISSLGAYTIDEIIQAFLDAIAALDDVSLAADSLYDAIPEPPIPAPPPYLPPFPPIYIGPPVPGPGGPSTPPRGALPVVLPWFYDDFDIIDPAVWTDYSWDTGDLSIVGAKLKLLSNGAGHAAWMETVADATIPASFDLEFELKVSSGTGYIRNVTRTGVHEVSIIFQAPDTLRFRQKDPLGYKDIDVGDYMGLTYTWKFVYNGTTVDIYRDGNLIDSGLTVYDSIASKGLLILSSMNVVTAYLDDYTITPN